MSDRERIPPTTGGADPEPIEFPDFDGDEFTNEYPAFLDSAPDVDEFVAGEIENERVAERFFAVPRSASESAEFFGFRYDEPLPDDDVDKIVDVGA